MTEAAKNQKSALDRPWLTDGFVQRIRGLHRTRLRDLYPSEAWALYRVVPHCNTVLDLGCGSGAMFEIVRAISPKTHYTGVDINPVLVESARSQYASDLAGFIEADALHFLETCEARFDCIMSWAVLSGIPDFGTLVEGMIGRSSRYVLFDMRVANVEATVADTRLAYSVYDDIKAPFVIASFSGLLRSLRLHDKDLKSVEITGYDMPVGAVSWISEALPQPSVVSVVLERSPLDERSSVNPATDWYVNVPPHLMSELK